MSLMRKHRQPEPGFTLVELMVAVAVAAIFAVIALPSFRTYMLNARRDALVDDLTAALQYARNQALGLNQIASVCAGVGGVGATGPSYCATGAWTAGWDVVTTPVVAGTPVLLTTQPLANNNSTTTLKAVNGTTYFQFNGNGLISNLTATEYMVVCDSRGSAYARAVEVMTTGFVQASTTPGTAPDGTALTCP